MSGKREISQFEVIRQLRLPLIILVTYAHSYGDVEDGFSLLTSDWNAYEFLKLLVSQTLVKVAVPVFFIISGYLFFVNVKEWNVHVYHEKMMRRVKTLLLPYLVWNLLMAIKLKTFSWSLFVDPADMPLWFLRDLMVVSLLTPIMLIVLLPVYLTGIWAIQPGLNPLGLCFFTLGAFLGIRKKNLLEVMRRFEVPAYVLSLFLGITMMLAYNSAFFQVLVLCFRLTGGVAVFSIAQRGLHSIRSLHCSQHWQSLLSDAAYFIYLAHYVLFMSFIDEAFFSLFGTSTASICAHYLLCPLIKAVIFIFAYVLSRFTMSVLLHKKNAFNC